VVAKVEEKKQAPRAKLVTVTPEIAVEWLERNKNNRDVRDRVVERYAREMRTGGWGLSDQAISFSVEDEKGERVLLNGQHRLFAIVEANVPIQSFVVWDLPHESQQIMDIGCFRTADERFTLRGDMGRVSKRELAVARVMAGKGSGAFTIAEEREFLVKHRAAVQFAEANIKPGIRGISSVAVLAVVARAYYHAEREELERFCRILCTNIPEGEGVKPVFLLRRLLTDSANTGGKGRLDSYQRTERALSAFIKGESLVKLVATDREMFPLPEEQTAKK
jgi:hypothetical protein